MSGTTTQHEPVPAGPTDLRWRAWWGVLRRTVARFQENKITDWAAALTYYSVLSVFPALLVLTSLLGLLGPTATRSLIDTVHEVGNTSGTRLLEDAITQLQGSRAAAGPLAILGLATSLWTASGYIGAFIRAANTIYRTEEGRPVWKTIPLQLALTAVMMTLVAACALGVVLTGRVADRIGHWVGLGSAGITVWDIAKWPVLLVLASLAIALLYWASPNARQPGFRWLTPGSTLAVLVWIAASVGFTVYATHFGSYNKVYGSLAGAVVFLVWLWLTNVAVLLGAQFDAELARGRQIEHGQPEDHEPVLPPRDDPE
ncbi:YihY/virulence factor BrkB family protein [Nocardia sp. NPDC004068]|uniref:YihY/virulence factor BrkB family protein n=1 Tax=Nocardia sp. NPDC004068 TaxID=3364303 RepID=UPI003697EED9